jgi:mannosyltransferase OCH1-like enzyme
MIEKILHQVWVGPYKMPKHIREFTEEMKAAHNEFQYVLWTDSNIPPLPDNLLKIYHSMLHPATQCDLLRIYLCYIYGGFYLDVDWKLVDNKRGLNQINLDQDLDAVFIYHESPTSDDVSNGVMGAKKSSKLFQFLLENIKYENQWLGPNWLAQMLKQYFGYGPFEEVPYTTMLDHYNQAKILGISVPDFYQNYMQHISLASWYPKSEWNLKLPTGDYE